MDAASAARDAYAERLGTLVEPETYRQMSDAERRQAFGLAEALVVAAKRELRGLTDSLDALVEETRRPWQAACQVKREAVALIEPVVQDAVRRLAAYDAHERAEQQRRAAVAVKVAQDAADAAALETAEVLENAGDTEGAQMALAAATFAPQPHVERAVPKGTDAVVKRGPLKHEVHDWPALLRAMAAQPAVFPAALGGPVAAAIRRWGQIDEDRALAGGLPGVRFWREAQVAVGRAS
jgi:hypothetical protein